MRNKKTDKRIKLAVKSTQSDKKEFLAKVIQYNYELERSREESILEQTNRMLVFLSLYTAALYTAFPNVYEYLEDRLRFGNVCWIFAVVITVLIIINLGVTLAAQWRYRYITLPDFEDVVHYLNSTIIQPTHKKLWRDYTIKYISEMLKSLEKNNNLRCKLLKISMVLFYVTLAVTVLMIAVLATL